MERKTNALLSRAIDCIVTVLPGISDYALPIFKPTYSLLNRHKLNADKRLFLLQNVWDSKYESNLSYAL